MILMDSLSPTSIIDYVNFGGVIVVLGLILVGGFRRWWVFGWYYREMIDRNERLQQETKEWRELALRSTNLVDSMQEIARAKGMP